MSGQTVHNYQAQAKRGLPGCSSMLPPGPCSPTQPPAELHELEDLSHAAEKVEIYHFCVCKKMMGRGVEILG